jgi:cell division protein FtsB
MDIILDNLGKVKLVRRHSSLLAKAVLLSVVLCSTAALLALHASLDALEGRTAALSVQAVALEQEQQDLQIRIDQLGTDESTRQIAQEELGLVDPDTIIIIPQQ